MYIVSFNNTAQNTEKNDQVIVHKSLDDAFSSSCGISTFTPIRCTAYLGAETHLLFLSTPVWWVFLLCGFQDAK